MVRRGMRRTIPEPHCPAFEVGYYSLCKFIIPLVSLLLCLYCKSRDTLSTENFKKRLSSDPQLLWRVLWLLGREKAVPTSGRRTEVRFLQTYSSFLCWPPPIPCALRNAQAMPISQQLLSACSVCHVWGWNLPEDSAEGQWEHGFRFGGARTYLLFSWRSAKDWGLLT